MKETTANTTTAILMSPKEVAAATTLSVTLLRSMAAEKQFPTPCRIGTKRQAWVRSEVTGWIADRISSRTAQAAA